MFYPTIYVLAIAAANLLAATFGPSITPYTAFLLIGLDLSLRDHLHDRWRDWRKMALLIGAGGLASWIVQPSAGRIALASTVAFVVSASLDAVVYERLRLDREGNPRPFLHRANGSNLVGASVDSVLFPTLAFGAFLPLIVLGQFAAKIGGGAVWAYVIERLRRRALARSEV